MKVKIYGAGSIGNHIGNASRVKGWDVTICDVDPKALERTQKEIYPTRYGKWDNEIKLSLNKDAPKGGFDMIVIGTPPDSHVSLALESIKENPKIILVEKPFSTPDLEGLEDLKRQAAEKNIQLFVGYDHSVGLAAEKVKELIKTNKLGLPETIDVEFREHWGGIFNAHPWLAGPHDSYLGFWKRGGGSLGEHSHALHLWLYFSELCGTGKVTSVNANLDYVQTDKVAYDKLACLNVTTQSKVSGRVVQDVVTKPTRKWARLQWTNDSIEWQANFEPGIDVVRFNQNGKVEEFKFKKTRPDDFILEMNHIEAHLKDPSTSPIRAELGLDAMLIINAAHKSAQNKKYYSIDYSKGYRESAIS